MENEEGGEGRKRQDQERLGKGAESGVLQPRCPHARGWDGGVDHGVGRTRLVHMYRAHQPFGTGNGDR
jgi:hypothetical protein